MKFFSNNKNKTARGGFMMLYAILLSTVILTIGIGALNVILKSVALSGAVRESQYAFYVANSGAECALWYDITQSYFGILGPPAPPAPITCEQGGAAIPVTMTDISAGCNPECSFTFEVPYDFGLGGGDIGCASVQVIKNYATFDSSVISRGYNVSPCSANRVNKVERGLQVEY